MGDITINKPPFDTEHELVGFVTIPPQPEVLGKVQFEMQQEYPEMGKIAGYIASDEELSQSVMRMINSAYFGITQEINSVQHALSLMGLNLVYNLAASVLFRILMQKDGVVTMPRYWDNATDIAKISSAIAKRLGVIESEQAFMAGMFYDCGMPVMAQNFDNYKEVLSKQNSSSEESFTELENHHFNTNHNKVGYDLTKAWCLSENISDVTLNHHDLDYLNKGNPEIDPRSQKLDAILKIAEHYANSKRDDSDNEWKRYKQAALDVLDLTGEDLDLLEKQIVQILKDEE